MRLSPASNSSRPQLEMFQNASTVTSIKSSSAVKHYAGYKSTNHASLPHLLSANHLTASSNAHGKLSFVLPGLISQKNK
eukprot:scaffold11553_cov39-Cyclotella_meneghiniana.AAC.3